MNGKRVLTPDGDVFSALACAFLAALITLGVRWCFFREIGWGYVAAGAAMGLVMGWWSGERAIDFLKTLFWYS